MPPPDMPRYMWFLSRGSMRIECIFPPSGVMSFSPPVHFSFIGWSLKPPTASHVTPASAERNSPCGDVPAHQMPGSLACPGANQNV